MGFNATSVSRILIFAIFMANMDSLLVCSLVKHVTKSRNVLNSALRAYKRIVVADFGNSLKRISKENGTFECTYFSYCIVHFN